MKYFFYILSIVIIFAINVGLFGFFPIKGQIPNLILLLMLNFAVDKKNLDFVFFAFVGGIFLDFSAATFFGGFTLGLLLAGFCTYALAGNLFFLEVNWKSLSALLLVNLAILNLVLWVFNLVAVKFSWLGLASPFNLYLNKFAVSFFYNWLLLYPMYLVSNRLKDFVYNFNLRNRGVVK